MPEVFSSAETSLELVDPITDAVIMAIPFLRDDSFSESPIYGPRGYHRSAAVSAARLRSKGTITIRKDAEGMAFAREVERWQKGVIWYPMGSDLKGKRFRHPHIRKVMTQPDGTKEYRTAYDVRLSDRTLSRPDAGLVSESFTFEVQGGFDSPGSERGEPVRAFDFHRTGSKTYVGLDGQLRTVGDGVAAFGLPGPVARRNLFNNSIFNGTAGWGTTNSAILSVAPPSSLPPGYPSSIGEGRANAVRLTLAGGANAGNLAVDVTLKAGEAITLAGAVYIPSSVVAGAWGVKIANAGYSTVVEAPITERDQWVEKVVTYTAPSDGTYRLWFGSTGASTAGQYIFVAEPQWSRSPGKLPYQPTNATGPDLTHPLNGAGLALEGAGTNLFAKPLDMGDTGVWADNAGTVGRVATTAPDGTMTAWTLTDDSTSVNEAIQQTPSISTGTNPYSNSIFVKKDAVSSRVVGFYFPMFGGTPQDCLIQFRTDTGAYQVTQGSGTIRVSTTPDGLWWRIEISKAGANNIQVGLRIYPAMAAILGGVADSTITGSVTVWCPQLEQNPWATSAMPNGARQADLGGIVPPHNLLAWSTDLANPIWKKENSLTVTPGFEDPDKTMTAFKLSKGAQAFARLRQDVEMTSAAVTESIWLKAGSLNKALLSVYPSGDSVVLPLTNQWQRFSLPRSIVSGIQWVMVYLDTPANTTAGDIYAWHPNFHIGYTPGVDVPTTDSPILPPPSPALDPAWSQNGRVRFRVLPPPISTGKDYAIIGSLGTSGNRPFQLWRFSATPANDARIYFDRKPADGSLTSGQVSATKSIYDGATHDVILEWTNYFAYDPLIGAVRRFMWQRIWIDGVKVAEQDVAALYGATRWSEIDPSRLISDGNVFATISAPLAIPAGGYAAPGGVIVEFPTLPNGAVPDAA